MGQQRLEQEERLKRRVGCRRIHALGPTSPAVERAVARCDELKRRQGRSRGAVVRLAPAALGAVVRSATARLGGKRVRIAIARGPRCRKSRFRWSSLSFDGDMRRFIALRFVGGLSRQTIFSRSKIT